MTGPATTKEAMLSAEKVRDVLRYRPETGLFYWRRPFKSTNIGRLAGSASVSCTDGYIKIRIGRTSYRAHRLAWLYVHGEWPDGVIDHINHIRTDNRIANLRVTSTLVNNENTQGGRRNQSRYRGVSVRKWVAHCAGLYIGSFNTEKQAALAYNKAAIEIYGANALLNEVIE